MRHPIVVLEGPDAAGKTTWANEYCRQTGARYLHLPLRRRMYEHQAMSLALAVRWSCDTPVLIDRHWPSEQLYAAAYRGGSTLVEEAKRLDKLMTVLGVTYVVCLLSSPARMFAAFERAHCMREEMYQPDERYQNLVKCYFDWWHGTAHTETHLGHCESLRGFGNMRPLTAHLYDYERMAATPLDFKYHVMSVHGFACDAIELTEEDAFCQDLVNCRHLLLQHLGLNQ